MREMGRLTTMLGVLIGAAALLVGVNGANAATLTVAGNPGGHVPVPPAGRAVNTSRPDHVIGHGTPASCTSAAVVRAVAAGASPRFTAGPSRSRS
jgi:hypothetical protein